MSQPELTNDSLRRGPSRDEQFRVVTLIARDAVAEACRRGGYKGIDAVVLGRAFVGGYLLSASNKRDAERLRLQIAGEGQVGQVIVDVHGDGRGRAALQAALPPEHALHILLEEHPRPVIGPVVGLPGTLTVTRDLALSRQYQGHVELFSAEIDEDLEAYLLESEQVASLLRAAVYLGPDGEVLAAAGVLVQALPGTDPAEIEACRQRLAHGELLRLIKQPHGHDDIAGLALGLPSDASPLSSHAVRAVEFHCDCGPERARRVLTSLGVTDLLALADEQEITEVRCNFCGRVTEVDAPAVRELAEALEADLARDRNQELN